MRIGDATPCEVKCVLSTTNWMRVLAVPRLQGNALLALPSAAA
jgi:hypothetical protein